MGKKLAERLVVELKDKLDDFAVAPAPIRVQGAAVDDVLSALVNLGYQRPAAEKAIEQAVAKEKELAGDFDGLFRGGIEGDPVRSNASAHWLKALRGRPQRYDSLSSITGVPRIIDNQLLLPQLLPYFRPEAITFLRNLAQAQRSRLVSAAQDAVRGS